MNADVKGWTKSVATISRVGANIPWTGPLTPPPLGYGPVGGDLDVMPLYDQ